MREKKICEVCGDVRHSPSCSAQQAKIIHSWASRSHFPFDSIRWMTYRIPNVVSAADDCSADKSWLYFIFLMISKAASWWQHRQQHWIVLLLPSLTSFRPASREIDMRRDCVSMWYSRATAAALWVQNLIISHLRQHATMIARAQRQRRRPHQSRECSVQASRRLWCDSIDTRRCKGYQVNSIVD